MNKSPLFKRLSIGLLALWLGLFVLVPNLMIVVISFLRRHETDFVAWEFSFENYLRLADPLYFQVFSHSFAMALLTTMFCLLLGYPFALALSRMRKSVRQILLMLVIIPFWTNSLIRAYAIKAIIATNGLMNTALKALGLIDAPLKLVYTESAVIIGLVYLLLPFMILPLFAVLEKHDIRHLEAAADLGANRWQAFWHITLPLSLPGIIAGCLMVMLPALGMFYISDLLGGAKNLVVGNVIKNQFLDARDWPFGSAASIALTIVMALFLLAYYRTQTRSKTEPT